MNTDKFNEKMGMIADPYFDREFFTNLIYCIDRKKTIREMFEAFIGQLNESDEFTDDLDRSLLQVFCAFQASSLLRQNYEWLPIAQSFFSASLYRGDSRKHLGYRRPKTAEVRACTLIEFTNLIRCETRHVESAEQAWESFLFLLENRTTRAQAISSILAYAVMNSDPLSLELLARAAEVAMACGWKSNANIFRRPFMRFWQHPANLETVTQGWKLSRLLSPKTSESEIDWNPAWGEDVWSRLSTESAESAIEALGQILTKGIGPTQLFSLLALFRGRVLYSMKTEQWPRAAASLMYGNALESVAYWCPEIRGQLLCTSVLELCNVAQVAATALPQRHTGERILDGISLNISKDRLILRLDDLLERGERHEALEVASVIIRDQGLSHSLRDRLLLIASKQDAWTFDQKTMAIASILTKSHEAALRFGIHGLYVDDSLYGLLRFLADQRDQSLEVVASTGTYGNRLSRSKYDVSGGARIVDRFVFNQIRNAQRLKIWPSDN